MAKVTAIRVDENVIVSTVGLFVFPASKVQNQMESNKEVAQRETHEDEMERMRREVQQCKEFIHAQQQLLQVSPAFLYKMVSRSLKV